MSTAINKNQSENIKNTDPDSASIKIDKQKETQNTHKNGFFQTLRNAFPPSPWSKTKNKNLELQNNRNSDIIVNNTHFKILNIPPNTHDIEKNNSDLTSSKETSKSQPHNKADDISIKLDENTSIKYENIRETYDKFKELCSIKEITLKTHKGSKEEESNNGLEENVMIAVLLSFLKKGSNAFPVQTAHINDKDNDYFIDKNPNEEGSSTSVSKNINNSKITTSNNEYKHTNSNLLYDHLKNLNPIIDGDKDLEENIKNNPDLKTRLGAAALLKMATEKEFTPGPLAGSAITSFLLGFVFESMPKYALVTLAAKGFFGEGFSPTKYAFQLAGLHSIPSFLIEGIDTLFVQAMLKTMNKEEWTFKDLIPNAIKGGLLASAGSYFNNVLEYKSTGSHAGDLALNTLTTEVAVLSAGSGVPMEVKENEAKMNAALTQAIQDGLLEPVPEDKNAEEYIKRFSQQVRSIIPGDSIAEKSITFAAIMGIIPLILSGKVTDWVPEHYLNTLRLTLFNPIEAIAINSLTATSKFGGMFGLLTSDDQKHTQLAKLIINKNNVNEKQKEEGNPEKNMEISDKQLEDIFHPPVERGFQQIGRGVINGISSLFSTIPTLAHTLGIKNDSRIGQRIPYENLKRQGDENV